MPSVKLSSREHQALKAFNELLTDFATLGEILGKVKRHVAIETLAKLASEKKHQPEGGDGGAAPIQVIGLTETPGLDFNYVWLLGAFDAALPGDAAPNPFLPIELQRELRMPGSSPELEEEYKVLLLSGLIASADTFIASYPLVSDDKERRAAPLIKEGVRGVRAIELSGETELSPVTADSMRFRDILLKSAVLDDMQEGDPVPVGEVERDGIRGFTSILRDQSACPFRAFATHRLNASALEEPSAGLTPMEKGSFAHGRAKTLLDGDERPKWAKKLN